VGNPLPVSITAASPSPSMSMTTTTTTMMMRSEPVDDVELVQFDRVREGVALGVAGHHGPLDAAEAGGIERPQFLPGRALAGGHLDQRDARDGARLQGEDRAAVLAPADDALARAQAGEHARLAALDGLQHRATRNAAAHGQPAAVGRETRRDAAVGVLARERPRLLL